MATVTSRELPMPIVTHLTNLKQAYATLQHCWARLSRSLQGVSGPTIDIVERRLFQRWLEQWEQAFTAYLSNAMAGMKGEDLTRCRILKANHLACTVLSSEGGPDLRSFDVFEAEFQAIAELSTAVLQSRAQGAGSSGSEASRASSAAVDALDVKAPLHVVATRCRRTGIRNQAVELLSKMNS